MAEVGAGSGNILSNNFRHSSGTSSRKTRKTLSSKCKSDNFNDFSYFHHLSD